MLRHSVRALILAVFAVIVSTALVEASDAKDKVEAQKLVRQLGDKDELEVEKALQGLAKLGDAGIEPLIKATNDGRTWVRVQAWSGLASIPSAVPRIRPLLIEKLRKAFPVADVSPWELSREFFLFTMVTGKMSFPPRHLSPKPKSSKEKKEIEERDEQNEKFAWLDLLIDIGMTDHAVLRGELAAEMNADPAAGLPVLRRAYARAAAGKAFDYPDVTRDLASKESAVIRGALITVSNDKEAKSKHTAAIMTHLDSTDAFVRAEALMAIDAEFTLQRAKLEALLQDPDAFVRLQAARALIHCAAAFDAGFKHLEAARTDEKPAVRRWAVQELGLLSLDTKMYHPGTNGDPTRALRLQYVVAALADPAPEVRMSALEAVVRFKAEAKSALPEVKKLTRDKDAGVAEIAKAAVAKIES